MLEQIMREVAEEAKESNRKATERYFEAMTSRPCAGTHWRSRLSGLMQ